MMSVRGLLLHAWKFFFAGKGLSFRTGQSFGESMLVGAVTGLVVVAFRYMIDLGRRFILEGLGGHAQLAGIADGCAFGQR